MSTTSQSRRLTEGAIRRWAAKQETFALFFPLFSDKLMWFQLGSPEQTRHLRQFRGQATERLPSSELVEIPVCKTGDCCTPPAYAI